MSAGDIIALVLLCMAGGCFGAAVLVWWLYDD